MRTASLDHLCAAASDQAAAFETRPLKPWRPTAAAGWTRWFWLIAAAGTIGALLGLVLLPRGSASVLPVDHRPSGGAVTMAPQGVPARPAPDPHGPVRVSGEGIAMDLRGMEFRRAVSQLAQATGTRLHGVQAVADRTDRVDLRWRGSEPLGAWRALLGGRIGHTVSCGEHQPCDVWLVHALPAAPVSHRGLPAMPPHRVLAAPSHGAPPMPATRAVPDAGSPASDSLDWVAPSSHGEEPSD